MNWEDILKAEAEAETKLNEAINDAKWAYEQIENLMNYDTSSPENFFVNEQGQQEKIIQPNSYRGQRLKLQGVVNMLKEAHQTLLDVQTELRKPASGGNPDFDKNTESFGSNFSVVCNTHRARMSKLNIESQVKQFNRKLKNI